MHPLEIKSQLSYDPSDVNIRRQTFSVGDIVEMIHGGQIELFRRQEFQRRTDAWGATGRSRLIESLLMRIPLPIFYLDGSSEFWIVIDGLHRLTTLFEFIAGKGFELEDLEYLKDIEGLSFQELPFSYQRVIMQSQIEAYVVNPGTPEQVKLNIFQRINTGGKSLTRQEIRTAYYRGKPVKFIDRLSKNPEFLTATRNKITPKYGRDREVVLRFFTFLTSLDFYQPPLELFLDRVMESIENYEEATLDEIAWKFERAMIAAKEIFGELAFYPLNIRGERTGSQLNIALFEGWAVNLAKLTAGEISVLSNAQQEIVGRQIDLFQEIEFHRSISSATASRKAVTTRFFMIEELIKKVLHAG